MEKTKKSELDQEFHRVIVPVDGSKLSKKAAELGCEFAKKANIDLLYLYVNHIPATAIPPGEATYAPNLTETLKEQGQSILDEIEKTCSNQNINLQTKMIDGVPAEEIIDISTKGDLIIMGSKGHSTFERVLVGSVSEKVLHHSDASVMIVR